MSGISLLCIKKKRRIGYVKLKNRWLFGCPQRRGECIRALKQSPKKPNSAERSVAYVRVPQYRKKLFVYIPGIKHSITTHTTLLYRGGKTQDLPRMQYKVIRGAIHATPVAGRTKARSKYGVKRMR